MHWKVPDWEKIGNVNVYTMGAQAQTETIDPTAQIKNRDSFYLFTIYISNAKYCCSC